MKRSYHYTECGLDNIYLSNGFKFKNTSRGQAVSINDLDGLHKAIGLYLVLSKKDLTGQEIRFLRHEMLLSQWALGNFLGVGEQTVHRWENNKTAIPKSSERLLRLLYREHIHDRNGKISTILKQVADLEDKIDHEKIFFTDTSKGWQSVA